MRDKIKELKETLDVYRVAQKDTANDIDTWEKLQEDIDDGKTVYTPIIKTKRKRVQQKSARKRRQRDPDDSDDDFITSDEESMHSESDSDSDNEIQAPRNTLTEDDIKSKLKELRDAKKGARREGSALTSQIKELQDHIKDSNQKIAVIKAEVSHICIAGRNDYSKRAIQQDFAAGIKELVGFDHGKSLQPRY
jgi:chromosome segregation ATPase